MDAACSKTDATTIGGADGTASVIATGGTAPYTYLWSNGQTTASITGLTAGTYTVTVTDLNGCTAICMVTVQEPGCNLSANATGTNVSCNAGTDGTAAATASGNLVPATYLWSNGETTASITGLTAGTYTVTVTETPTCTAVTSYTVTEPTLLDAACSKTDATTIGGSRRHSNGKRNRWHGSLHLFMEQRCNKLKHYRLNSRYLHRYRYRLKWLYRKLYGNCARTGL
jgi:hypothetical protein